MAEKLTDKVSQLKEETLFMEGFLMEATKILESVISVVSSLEYFWETKMKAVRLFKSRIKTCKSAIEHTFCKAATKTREVCDECGMRKCRASWAKPLEP